MDVSKNRGTPKSSILIGFSLINHPFWGTTIFGNIHISLLSLTSPWLGLPGFAPVSGFPAGCFSKKKSPAVSGLAKPKRSEGVVTP